MWECVGTLGLGAGFVLAIPAVCGSVSGSAQVVGVAGGVEGCSTAQSASVDDGASADSPSKRPRTDGDDS